MALSNLSEWNKEQGTIPASACGSACGASDKPEEKYTYQWLGGINMQYFTVKNLIS